MSINLTTQEEKAKRTRQALIDASAELFFKHGVQKVTVEDICSSCGVTKGSFYYHFFSKDHIVGISINAGLDKYIQASYVRQEYATIYEQLLHLNLFAFEYFKKIGQGLTGRSFISLINSLEDVVTADRKFVEELAKITDIVREQGLMPEMSRAETYHYFSSILTGVLMEWCIGSGRQSDMSDWEKLIRIKTELSLKAL